jgi:uncharacterized RDD family membrane protein YckC
MPVCVGAVAPDAETDAEYWRREVAARLQRYRSRRKPRAPRYPSLRLPFDSAENTLRPAPGDRPAYVTSSQAAPVAPVAHVLTRQNVALQLDDSPVVEPARIFEPRNSVPEEYLQEQSAKIIEFPRSAAIPVFQKDELAEPMWDHPRIVEAPEVVPLPPAMGGILIETIPGKEAARLRPEDVPVQSASLGLRILAGLVDSLILAAALTAFGAIFLRINPVRGPILLLAGGLVMVGVLVWAAYQFLFVVYTGSTPGLRVARLRLAKFDGSPLPRRLRRWRVLASFLSAFSLGLGYLWSVLDEDGLCWHDRITRTHVQCVTASRPDSSF